MRRPPSILYLCPDTTRCVLILLIVSSHYYLCVLIILYMFPICVLILLYMCPHVTICVLILLCMCPHATIYVLSYKYMCPHTTTYVSSHYYICVFILYMCVYTVCVGIQRHGTAEAKSRSASREADLYEGSIKALLRERPLKTCYISRYAELEKQKAAREADLTKTNEGLASRNEVIERQLIELKATYKGTHFTCFPSAKVLSLLALLAAAYRAQGDVHRCSLYLLC